MNLAPAEEFAYQAPCDIRINNVALTDTVPEKDVRTTLKFLYFDISEGVTKDKSKAARIVTICNLTPYRNEQHNCDIVLHKDEEYGFEVFGPNPIDISGIRLLPDEEDVENQSHFSREASFRDDDRDPTPQPHSASVQAPDKAKGKEPQTQRTPTLFDMAKAGKLSGNGSHELLLH
ncbi:hypothetical protein BDZ97DRAFT_1754972 [Flammula alnicola]|nr:hypothetical protein BDZ97DRAFT_1754972 [Flammula alnicola]